MEPFYSQLNDRYAKLQKIESSLQQLTTEDIPDELLETLGIDLYPMDIETGATSPSVTSYYLPRTNFPTSRVMKGDDQDSMFEMGNKFDDPDYTWQRLKSRFFYLTLKHTLKMYSFQMSEDFSSRFGCSQSSYDGWMSDGRGHDLKDRDDLHYFTRWFSHVFDRPTSANDTDEHKDTAKRSKMQEGLLGNDRGEIPFESEPITYDKCPSHVCHFVTLHDCGNDRPLVPEVLSMVEEILYAMRRQAKKLQRLPLEASLQNFHYILPRMAILQDKEGRCRILCAYFDGRLRVQYTRCVSFTEFAVEPLPGKDYIETIDLQKYYDTMDTLLKWIWPIPQGDTSKNKLISATNEPESKGEDQLEFTTTLVFR